MFPAARVFASLSVLAALSCGCPNPGPDDPRPPGGIQWINCSRPNEHYLCGSACQNTCETLGQVCPIVNIRCNDSCYCCPGFARDCQDNCVPEPDCPPKGTCSNTSS
ncbi:hypothetical protein HUJ04_008940 [Dendroctonus ponderosae]|nr:hypothetical protein HUJ04_008940 [Dendroctonus ponderosae]KAH1008924.1 hypothetical protein HUJ05_009416 [Dendroctonus ponderosae]